MRCDEVENRMMRFVDERLDPETSRKVEAHLSVCPLCRRVYAEEVEMVAVFHASPPEPAPAQLVGDVMQGIETVSVRRSGLRFRPWTLVLFGAALVGAGVGTWSWGSTSWTAMTSVWGEWEAVLGMGQTVTTLEGQMTFLVTSVMQAWTGVGTAAAPLADYDFALVAVVTAAAMAVCVGLGARVRSMVANKESEA
jgi:predicted anti-sigma-YlaC factor YlaD